MRKLLFNIAIVVACVVNANTDSITTSRGLARIAPHAVRVQTAGNMGMVALGPTWLYGKNHQWETSILLGYTPKQHNAKSLTTLTLKEDFTPWSIGKNKVKFQPLSAGTYLNIALGNDFWDKQPKRYPKGYYWFSTRLRPNFYLGERLRINNPVKPFAAASIFYEISTCDYYLIQGVKNHWVTPDKYLTLSLGLQLEW